MTDTGTPIAPVAPVSPATPPPADPSSPVAPVAGEPGIEDFQAKYTAEVEARKRERNLYKPAMRVLDGLDPDSQQALADFAEMVRKGDTEGMTSWMEESISIVHGGKSAADVIAARQTAAEQAARLPGEPAAAPTQAQLTREEIERIADERADRRHEERTKRAEQQASVDAEFATHGISDPAIKKLIIDQAIRTEANSLEGPVKWYRDAVAAQAAIDQQRAVAAASAAAAVPAPAPAGSAPATAPSTMSARESAIARLTGKNR